MLFRCFKVSILCRWFKPDMLCRCFKPGMLCRWVNWTCCVGRLTRLVELFVSICYVCVPFFCNQHEGKSKQSISSTGKTFRKPIMIVMETQQRSSILERIKIQLLTPLIRKNLNKKIRENIDYLRTPNREAQTCSCITAVI